MKTALKIITFFVWIALLYVTGLTSEWRLRSMGNARLALLDSDNELNLYQYTFNPAYMLFDEHQDWLKFSAGGDYYHSSFRRKYDPENEQNVYFNFTGYKIMAANQAIWGKVRYTFHNQYHRPFAIEPQPYADDPVLLADTTIGNITADGPEIEIAYHYQPWSRLGLGMEVLYDLSTSLKEQYTRPRTIHRDFAVKFGLAYHLLPYFVIGSWLQASFLQDQIELNKSWDGKDIYTRRYRSELVYRGIVQEFDRYINLDKWHYNLGMQFLRPQYHLLISFDYVFNTQEVADNTGTIRKMDSYWYQDGYQWSYRSQIFINKLTVGIYGSYLIQDDFSKHPDLPILITERSRKVYEIGAGLSLPIRFLLLVGEVGFQQLNESFQDYQSKLSWDGQNNSLTGIGGCELTLDPIHYLRLGYNYNDFKTGFESPHYFPEHQRHRLSLGLAEVRSTHEIEIHFDYTVKNSRQTSHSFNGWQSIIHTRIFIP